MGTVRPQHGNEITHPALATALAQGFFAKDRNSKQCNGTSWLQSLNPTFDLGVPLRDNHNSLLNWRQFILLSLAFSLPTIPKIGPRVLKYAFGYARCENDGHEQQWLE